MSEQQTIPTPADLYATYHERLAELRDAERAISTHRRKCRACAHRQPCDARLELNVIAERREIAANVAEERWIATQSFV